MVQMDTSFWLGFCSLNKNAQERNMASIQTENLYFTSLSINMPDKCVQVCPVIGGDPGSDCLREASRARRKTNT